MQQGRWKRGQSTLEYILVVAAILAAVILGVQQFIRPAVNQTMTDAGSAITKASGKIGPGLGLQ